MKCVQLTELGEQCYEKNEALKANLEKKIIDKIGEEKFGILKEILKFRLGFIVSIMKWEFSIHKFSMINHLLSVQ